MARGRFFGKFMGGSDQQSDEFVDEEISETPQARRIDTDEETDEARGKSRVRKSSKTDEGQGSDEADTGDREEWINEYEGQLTLDVYQTRDNVIIKSTIAGVKTEDLDITIANDMVTIKGERKKQDEVRPEDYFYQECYWGPFSRSIILPVDIDVESVDADLKDGILTVILPKAAKAKTKKVKIRNNE